MSEWPQLDPITNRMICHACWNHIHQRKNLQGQLVDACDTECDCVHRSEQTWAAIEKKKRLDAKREKRKNLKAALQNSPLRVESYQKDVS